ncbi:hypothetical protein [Priestia megaterium]|uniref:hypothetical protein n=1 Tax=Priestia megaterium TaxID=1404 RepID=UPI00203E507C|nr:hypothetical protein [Priestia megaterium]MCM3197231.1 hypothetical protein [Priestia megaterium]
MPKTSPDYKSLNADILEDLFKEYAKGCIEEGVSKKDFLVQLLEKELFKDSKKEKKKIKGHFPDKESTPCRTRKDFYYNMGCPQKIGGS